MEIQSELERVEKAKENFRRFGVANPEQELHTISCPTEEDRYAFKNMTIADMIKEQAEWRLQVMEEQKAAAEKRIKEKQVYLPDDRYNKFIQVKNGQKVTLTRMC